MNLNKVLIIGNLTRDPEVRSLPSGQQLASFGVATNRVWNDKQGQKQQQVEFHNIVLFGRLAELSQQYLAKGRLVFIEGRIQTRTWTGQDGIKKWRTEIIGENMQFGPRPMGRPDEPQAEKKGFPAPSNVTSAVKPHTPPQEEIGTVEYPEDSAEGDINPDEIPF